MDKYFIRNWVWLFLFLALVIPAIVDISNLDKIFAEIFLGIHGWDLNFNYVVTIVIPLGILYFGSKIDQKYLRFGNLDKYKLTAIREIFGSLSELNDYSDRLFSPLKSLPRDKDQQVEYYEDLFQGFADKNNAFRSIFNKNRIFLEDKELESDIEEYVGDLLDVYFAYLELTRSRDDHKSWVEIYPYYKEASQKLKDKNLLTKIRESIDSKLNN